MKITKKKELNKVYWAGILGEILGMYISFYIFDHIMDWNWSFVLPSMADYLPVARLAVLSSGMIKIIACFKVGCFLKNLLIMMGEGIGVISMYYLVTIFPFDFGQPMMINWLVRVALILAIIGASIGILVRMIKTIFGKD